MLTAEDIKLLAASGEGYNAEFKFSVPSKVKELTEEVCAFANAAGGVLLIGIDDSNKIVGVTIDNKVRSAIQNSLNEITPQLQCSLSLIDVDGKTIGVIEVPSGPNKPYVLSGAIHVRQGPNTQKLTTAEQMRDFFQKSDKIYFDEVPCPDFDPNTMMDQGMLSLFKTESRIGSSVSNDQLYGNLKLYAEQQVFKNGAVLFFGLEPESFYEQAILRCVAFKGTDKRYITDDKVFGGSVFHQYQKAMGWIREKLNVRYDIEGQGGGPRKEIWEIPETVFKESIINALCHRDYYEKGAVINLEVFDDRIEISNPGGLVSAIPEADFGKRSHSRNPLIFGLFEKMRLVEKVGSGVGRIRDLMKEAGLPPPVFQKEGMFVVNLSRPIRAKLKGSIDISFDPKGNLTSVPPSKKELKALIKDFVEADKKILVIMNAYPQVTIQELVQLLKVSKSTVDRILKELRLSGVIIRTGSKKNSTWKIIKK